MNNSESEKPAHILLAQDEVRVILETLDAQTIPGLASPTFTAPEQIAVANQVARRTLRARRLAQIQEDGQLLVHTILLTAIGVVAYPEKTISALTFEAPGLTPGRLYAHQRGQSFTIHTLPETDIHRFSLLGDQTQWLAHIFRLSGLANLPQATEHKHQLVIAQTVFATMRDMVLAGDISQAISYLVNTGVPETDAQPLVETLYGEPRMVVLQTITMQTANEPPTKHDVSIIQSDKLTWLVVPAPAIENTKPLVIKTCDFSEIETLLLDWLA